MIEICDTPITPSVPIIEPKDYESINEKDTIEPKNYSEYHIEGVEVINQFPDYPAGCESVATVTVLNYVKDNLSVDEFINEHLLKSSRFYYEDGKSYGPSPWEYYVGNPFSSGGWGCMAPVIENALVSYFGSSDRVVNTTGTSLEELCKLYVANDIPVIVWATIAMVDVVWEYSWYLPDGTLFDWPGNEHCMVLVGYDEDNYYFNDSYSGRTVGWNKSRAENRFEKLGQQSIVILP